jgi:hypothetical protein
MPRYFARPANWVDGYAAPGSWAIGHWEAYGGGDGGGQVWTLDRITAALPQGWQWWSGMPMEGSESGSVGGFDIGHMLDESVWRNAGYTGPLLDSYGSGDSGGAETSQQLLDWMVAGDYKLGQGYDPATGQTVDQLFQGSTPVYQPFKFVENDNVFAAAFLAVASVVTAGVASWAAAGGGASAGASAAAVDAIAADSAVGVTVSAAEATAAGYGSLAAAEIAAASLAGAAPAAITAAEFASELAPSTGTSSSAASTVASSSSLVDAASTVASSGASIVDAIGSGASAVLKAAGAVLAPIVPQLITDKFAPTPTPASSTTPRLFNGQAPGATQALPLLLIAGAVALAFVALRK